MLADNAPSFAHFFEQATAQQPYPYQERFAEADQLCHLLRAPTGAGKTAAAILGWLWRYFHSGKPTPRRLIYCLPMRVLVEQSQREARKWIDNLKLTDVSVNVLMGGVETDEWYLHPERPAILIGTQDMLLSRVLNRGYGASRFHWPIDFGLLNSDSLWVFDEPQLMGCGVSTSAQMAGLRAALDTFGQCPSIWMSATLEPGWLETVDFRGKFPQTPLELGKDQYGDDLDPARPLHKRMTAAKTLSPLGAPATKEGKEVAAAVVKAHEKGTQTLVVLNTVDRARAVYAALKKDKTATKDILLVHSRFRPAERENLNEQLPQTGTDRIIVATQVVEAGVDISARTLVTELAPWASLVQRMGRCNRTGNDGPGRVLWIDLDREKQSLPYETSDLEHAAKLLLKLDNQDVSPKSLDELKHKESITLPFEHTHVLRRRDLLDLFDTAPDLSGNDIDVARFVRGDDPETDAQVFWRVLGPDGPADTEAAPHRRELCSVPVGSIKAFLKKSKREAYAWDHLDEEWRAIGDAEREVRPGLTIMLSTLAGGYSELGWDVESTAAVDPVNLPGKAPEATGGDPESTGSSGALTVAQHTKHVCKELEGILADVGASLQGWADSLKKAACWHDAGKAHLVFQTSVRRANAALDVAQLWAKSGNNGRLRHCRKHFRHELASALAALQHGLPFETAYLVATHHGKVRLSIRTLPDETQPENPKTMFAHGIHGGDILPDVDLGDERCPTVTLDLTPMQLGGETSWTAQALALRDALGPFRLAYLESLLRAADLRASKKEREGAYHA